eukprot:CAMPEP_0116896898 /NCGR_PEP_ID=MMETSP0467-20121206/6030_1 /TAXON_ID=283647 /ORGANISM="Mesodinium pulex, Strain SPMC105" /LENGTH=85 /DNA_ID=CAMNT_0004568305 /DNA_START=905 /DNA_END=1162 /DNA_ORIENTATION=+
MDDSNVAKDHELNRKDVDVAKNVKVEFKIDELFKPMRARGNTLYIDNFNKRAKLMQKKVEKSKDEIMVNPKMCLIRSKLDEYKDT